MQRMPRGATSKPPNRRPGNGFGRPLRPGPSLFVWPAALRHPSARTVDLETFLARCNGEIDLTSDALG